MQIAIQKQHTIVKAAQTQKRAAIWQAEKQLAVALIDHQKREETKRSQVEIGRLEGL